MDGCPCGIDEAFGEELPFSEGPIEPGDREALGRVFGDEGYQRYLQDQVNRQIIRDYLTNAIVLGYLPESDLAVFEGQVGTPEGRATMSLYMLMSSVEQAGELSAVGHDERLTPLKPGKGSPPFMHLIKS